jgi:signal transduction histidine kinase
LEDLLERINKRQFGLFTYVFAAVSLIVLSFLLLSNYVSYSSTRDTVVSQIQKSNGTVLKLFIKNIEKDVKFGVKPEVYSKCSALFNDESILEVKVFAENNEFCNFSKDSSEKGLRKESYIYFDNQKTNQAATVKLVFSSKAEEQILKKYLNSALIGFLFILLLLIWPLYILSKKLTNPIKRLAETLVKGNIQEINIEAQNKDIRIKEVAELYKSIQIMSEQIKIYEKENIEKAKKESLYQQASQIVHDIRNPILRLKLKIGELLSDVGIKNNINNDLEFIEELTREMLSQYKTNNPDKKDSSGLVEVTRIIEKNINDLKLDFPSCEILFENRLNQVGAYIEISSLSFSRIVYNLIKNACESSGKLDRVIKVSIDRQDGNYVFSVLDNGAGISTDNIKRVTEKGFTYGKKNGTGIGLNYCQEEITRFNGTLEIESEENEYALFKVSFKTNKSPIWGFKTLYIEKDSTLVIIDDEDEIHAYWKSIAGELQFSSNNIKMIHIKSAEEFKSLMVSSPSKDYKFIFDYDLGSTKGVDLIKEYSLFGDSVVISNHFDDESLLEFCESNGARLFPKQSIEDLKIKIINKRKTADTKKVVIIDDDQDLLKNLDQFLTNKGIDVSCFNHLSSFTSSHEDFYTNTMFLIDLNLDEPENGIYVSRELHSMGFRNLNLFSGQQVENDRYWIKDQISKADLDMVIKKL